MVIQNLSNFLFLRSFLIIFGERLCSRVFTIYLARIKENHLIVYNLKRGLLDRLKRPKDLTPCHGKGHYLWLTMFNRSCNGR
jgi:hypothetical protein